MEGDNSNNKAAFTFTWIIENFSHCVEPKLSCFESPEFGVDVLDDSGWCLSLYPKGIDDHFCINVYLLNLTFESIPITVDYELAILGDDGSCLSICNRAGVTFDKKFGVPSPSLGQTGLAQKDVYDTDRSKYLPGDALSVRCRMWKTGEDALDSVQFFARTRIGVTKTSNLWCIPEFSRHQLGAGIPFPVDMQGSLEGDTLEDAWLIIRISCEVCERPSLLSCKFSVLNSSKRAARVFQDSYRFVPNRDLTWTFPKFVSRRELIERRCVLLPNDVLSLLIELTFSTGVEHQDIEHTLYGLPIAPCATSGHSRVTPAVDSAEAAGSLSDDLLNLYLGDTLGDFELKAGDKLFPVHKAILCARSPVFKAMLASQEGVGDSLNVPDVDPDTLSRLLVYVYADALEDLEWESASKLFYASDKYQIPSLKQKCSSALKSNLAVDNACTVLALADKHQDRELSSAVLDFILGHDQEIMSSTEWLEFVESEARLAAKTLHELYRKKYQM